MDLVLVYDVAVLVLVFVADKGYLIWLYITTMLLIILLSILKEKDFNYTPLLSGRWREANVLFT
jgi:hypothetical protein